MAINLGTSPYYDDFDGEKNFHRILFKPGYAVQARELTQLQTILQNQIQRFGDHVFKDGSVVVGCDETFQFNVPYVKINDNNTAGITIAAASYETYKTSLVNATVSNELGVTAKIVRVDEDPTGQRVLYLKYETSYYDAITETTTTTFAANDALTIKDSNDVTLSFKFSVVSAGAIGTGSLYTIGDGIVYAEGAFVRHESQTQVLSFYDSAPSKNIGFRVVSSSVTSDDDVSLLDPAAGSYNYAAPGADRYKIVTQLESYDIGTTPDDGFYQLFIVEGGVVKRVFNKPQYAELQRVLAQRTFDESGNYVVSGLNINVREHLKTSVNNGRYTVAELGDASKILYGVEPGKAYVEGFDSELKATEYLTVSKATETQNVVEQQIFTLFGNYVYVKNVSGSWGLAEDNTTISLLDGATLVATAKFRLLQHHSGSTGTGSTRFYKLYMYGLTFESGKGFTDLAAVDTITATNSTATVAITPGDNLGGPEQAAFKLHEGTYNSLIFPTGSKAVVEYEDDTDYFFWKYLGEYTFDGSGNGSISVSGVNQTLAGSSATYQQDFIVVEPSGASYNLANITGYTVGSTTSGTLQINVADAGANRKVYARVRQGNGAPINLTLDTTYLAVDSSVLTGTSLTNLTTNKTLYLGVPHVHDIQTVHMAASSEAYPGAYSTVTSDAAWTDVTNDFELYLNSNDNVYNTSYIKYTGTESLAAKKFVIKFRNFARSSTLGYLNRNSYQSALIDFDPTTLDTGKQIYTYELPVYTSDLTGITYDLRDVIDFRPTVTPRTGYSGESYASTIISGMGASENIPVTTLNTTNGIAIPDPESVLTASFSFNLPRKDKIILTRDGEFKVLQGVSSLNPQTPADAPHAMTLATVELAPYPSLSTYASRAYDREDYAAILRLVDNRRYTMRDIGELEQRVNRLEYYTALSIAENRAANMLIQDSTGTAMLKKGILVDAFDGHDVGNVFDADYYAAIDTKNKILRAPYDINNIQFELDGNTDETIIIDYEEEGETTSYLTIAENRFASKSRVCGNALLGNYMSGNLRLDPPQLAWVDVNARPDVQVNYNGINDGWEFNSNAFSIHWNGWQTIWNGMELTNLPVLSITTVAGLAGLRGSEFAPLVSDITRNIATLGRMPENNLRTVGVRVLDVSVVPFIAEQVVTFTATGLKPGTFVKAYFDGEDVSEHCRYFTLPTGVTAATIQELNANVLLSQYEGSASEYGDNMIVDSSGTLIGQFLIPANRFRVGSKVFKLTDVSSTTSAAIQLQATGIPSINEGTIASTRFPDVRQDALDETQNSVVNRLLVNNPSTFSPTSYGDPMAQTFIVEGETDGAMVDTVLLYFKRKSSTKKFTIQIREVINGFPGNKIVPFSTKTLSPSEIVASATAATSTAFVFDAPVYLKNNTEYALVLLPESNTTDYEVWCSELGQNMIGTTERITQQPNVGVLFIPNNNTSWTALEAEDLKFYVYGRQRQASRTVTLTSAPVDYLTLSQTGTYTLKPGDVVKVFDDTQTTLGGTIDNVVGNVVTGAGTAFTTSLNVGDHLRMLIPATSVSGTLSINSGTPTTVTGTGTQFTTELKEGDILYQDNDNSVIGKVESITSNTVLTLTSAATAGSGIVYKVRAVLGEVKDIVSNTSLKLVEEYDRSTAFLASTATTTGYKDDTTVEGYISLVNGDDVDVYITSGYFTAGDEFTVGTSTFTVDSINNKTLTAFVPNFGILSVDPVTQVQLSYKLLDTSSTYYPSVTDSYISMSNGETVELPETYTLYSHSNTTGQIPTMKVKAVLSSTNVRITPIVDSKKLNMLVLGNDIDAEGSSNAIYVTRTVTLDGDGADDLRVFFDMLRPEACSVKVEAKLQRLEDDRPFADVTWVELDETAPTVYNSSISQEYSYSVPTASLVSYKRFAVRITMNSTDKSKTPLIKNLRAIAVI